MRISGTRCRRARTLPGLDARVPPILKGVLPHWGVLALVEVGADALDRVGEGKSQFLHGGVGRARTVRSARTKKERRHPRGSNAQMGALDKIGELTWELKHGHWTRWQPMLLARKEMSWQGQWKAPDSYHDFLLTVGVVANP